jgi:hypothetical protein
MKAKRAQPTETHPPTIHPPYPLTMESFYRWYAVQGCPKINPDYSNEPQPVSKTREEASVPNLTQTPTTRTASIVQRQETQHNNTTS